MSIIPPPQSIQTSGKPFIIHADIQVKEGKGDEFVAIAKKAAEIAATEGGVIEYKIGRNAEESKRDCFWFYEKYTNYEGFQGHTAGQSFGALASSGLIEKLYLHYVEEL